MKAARLNGDLLSRKGKATPTGLSPLPALAAVDPGSAGPTPENTADPPRDNRILALKSDKFGRVRICLRLDPERHLRLRLLAAHGCLSLQEALIAALDAYLGEEARNLSCECLHEAGEPCHDTETRAAGVQDPE